MRTRWTEFNEWANEFRKAQGGKLIPETADFIITDAIENISGSIDHAFYAWGYPTWGPRFHEFDNSSLGSNEVVLITAPYSPMPKFDPAEIAIDLLPIPLHGGTPAYVCCLRDPKPNGEVWRWFTDPLGGSTPPGLVTECALPLNSKYMVGVSHHSGGCTRLWMTPRIYEGSNGQPHTLVRGERYQK